MPVMVLAGDEEFELSREVARLRTSLVDPNWATMNCMRLENPPLAQIIEVASALPFGPGNKVILIDKCELFTKKRSGKGAGAGGDDEATAAALAAKKGKSKVSELDLFDQALGSVALNTYLIFACPHNFDLSLNTSKTVQKHTRVSEFKKHKFFPGSRSPELDSWCQREAKRFCATIADDAIQYLLEGLEAELRQVSAEIEKAAVRILPATHIKLETVVEMSPHHSHVFALSESWVTGKHKQALASAQELLSRQSAMPILAAMQTFLSKWIQIKALVEKFNSELPSGPGMGRRELPFPEMVRKIAAARGERYTLGVEKDLKRIARVPLETLIAKRVELTRLECLIKTGQVPEQHALELFLVG